MVRTVESPRCWATPCTRRLPPFCVSSALRMAGRCPSNCTSTTAPMTCVMRPVWLAGVGMKILSFEFLLSEHDLFEKPASTFSDHAPISYDRQFDRDIALGCLRVRADRVG